MLLYIVATVALAGAGFEHNLYNYARHAAGAAVGHERLGRFWIGARVVPGLLDAPSRRCWRCCATRCGGAARRWRCARACASSTQRLRGPALGAAGVARRWPGSAWARGSTTTPTSSTATSPRRERERSAAEYEKALLPFEKLPQPRITDVTLDVELYPREARAVTSGRYTIENPRGAPIGDVHVQLGASARGSMRSSSPAPR